MVEGRGLVSFFQCDFPIFPAPFIHLSIFLMWKVTRVFSMKGHLGDSVLFRFQLRRPPATPASFPPLPATVGVTSPTGKNAHPALTEGKGTGTSPALGTSRGGSLLLCVHFLEHPRLLQKERALSRSPRVHVSHLPTLTARARVTLIPQHLFIYLFAFLGPHPQHMGVPRLGV